MLNLWELVDFSFPLEHFDNHTSDFGSGAVKSMEYHSLNEDDLQLKWRKYLQKSTSEIITSFW